MTKDRAPKGTAEPILRFASPAGWDAWLAANHASESGVRLAIGKKGGDGPALGYAEAVEVALAWGWIDGQKLKHDADVFLQRFSRRRARSPWSKINREKAEALTRAGRMRPPGLAEVERARKDCRWAAAYDSALRHPLPRADGEKAGDAPTANREVRGHARAARAHSPAEGEVSALALAAPRWRPTWPQLG